MGQTTGSDRETDVEPLFSDIVATYQVPSPDDLAMIEVTVRGVMDDETPAGEYMFYDLYDVKGNCLNENEPFVKVPTRVEVAEYFILYYIDHLDQLRPTRFMRELPWRGRAMEDGIPHELMGLPDELFERGAENEPG